MEREREREGSRECFLAFNYNYFVKMKLFRSKRISSIDDALSGITSLIYQPSYDLGNRKIFKISAPRSANFCVESRMGKNLEKERELLFHATFRPQSRAHGKGNNFEFFVPEKGKKRYRGPYLCLPIRKNMFDSPSTAFDPREKGS
jgi:hypothetical protein